MSDKPTQRHTPGFVRVAKWYERGHQALVLTGLPEPDAGDVESGDFVFGGWMSFRSEADAREFARRWNCHEELRAALKEAESMLLVAMGNDLVFEKATREEIIAGHPGMQLIRAAIAKAESAT